MQRFHLLDPHEMAIPNGNNARKWVVVLLDESPIKTSFASK